MSDTIIVEMVMDAFRLARSGNHKTADSLKKAFVELYPESTDADRKSVFNKLAQLVTK